MSADDRETVWLCGGLRKPWRVCSYERDYGEFDSSDDALDFLRLLVDGNPDLRRLEGNPFVGEVAG